MNWDAIGAIAELLGAIGVIASLVYLATQIRQSRDQMGQNTRALQAGTYLEFNRQLGDAWQLDVPSSVVQTGLTDPRQLDEADMVRFEFWVSRVMHLYENAHYQYRVGLLDEDRWQMHLSGLTRTLTRFPGVRHWWSGADNPLSSPEFVALVEEILGEEPEQTDPAQ